MSYVSGELLYGDVADTTTRHYDKGKWAYLPHECDEWVIGGKKEVECLIKDLQEILKRMDK